MAKTKSTRNVARSSKPSAGGRSVKAAAETVATGPSGNEAEPGQARAPTKQALIIGLLRRKDGATLADLVTATGWLPHTTRAALTRLRQAGHSLDKSTGETGATVYRIAAPSPAARSRKAAS